MNERKLDKIERNLNGGIILLAGLSGVGKSTLIQDLLIDNPSRLRYLKDYTTRTKRPTDNDIEYIFVDEDEFKQIKAAAKDWQEGVAYGNYYGHDTAEYRQYMHSGKYLIGCCYPSIEDASSLDAHYSPTCITIIHIDIPNDTRAKRLITQRGEEGRSRLIRDASWTMTDDYRNRINYVFHADKSRKENRANFNNLIQRIIDNLN